MLVCVLYSDREMEWLITMHTRTWQITKEEQFFSVVSGNCSQLYCLLFPQYVRYVKMM